MLFSLESEKAWWIERGTWFVARSKRDDAAIVKPFGLDSLDLAFEKLGLVHVGESAELITITWSLLSANVDSLLEALDWALESTKKVRLCYFKEAWAGEVHPTGRAAVQRALRLRDLAKTPILPTTIIKRQSINNIERANAVLSTARREARDLGDPMAIVHRPIGSMGLYFGTDREGELRISGIGAYSEASRIFGEDWRETTLGSICDDCVEDEAYDRRVSRPYFEAIQEQKPIYDHVLGFMDTGHYKVWLPYQRLLLPRGQSLACFTRVSQSVEIDFMGERISQINMVEEVRPFGPYHAFMSK